MSEKEPMQGMNEQRLAEIVEAYGANPDRWPVAERGAAQQLLGRSSEARTLAAAARLDLLLDHLPAEEAPSAALTERIMAARPRAIPLPAIRPREGRQSVWRFLWPYGSPALPTGALALSMMLGLGLGATMQTQTSDTTTIVSADDSDQLVSLAFAENTYPEEWKP